MLYRVLKQTHPEYDAETWSILNLLYRGGFELRRRAAELLPKHPNELNDRYDHRVQSTSYVPHLGEIIDLFIANLFARSLTIVPPSDADQTTSVGAQPKDPKFYQDFANDSDRAGSPFASIVRKCATMALLKRKCLIAVDLPASAGAAVANQAQEEELGLARAYCYFLPIEEMLDWRLGPDGRFEWCILYRQLAERESPEAVRGDVIDEFKVWRASPDGARWQRFRTAPHSPDKEPKDNDDIPLFDEGTTSFPWIPIVRLELPEGLWVGNKIGTMALEHFQRRSKLVAAEDSSLLAIPLLKLGSEIGAPGEALPAEIQQDPKRGGAGTSDIGMQFRAKGGMVLGSGDSLEFKEPAGSCYELTDRELENLVDEMHRVAHQMALSVANTKQALGRSGESKQQDRTSTEVVLDAYGALFREFGVDVYNTVAAGRRDNKVSWVAHGLDEFDVADRTQLVTEAGSMDLINIPSPTFTKHYKTATALRLVPGLPVSTQDQIRQEIEEGVDAQLELKATMDEAMAEQALAPKPKATKPQDDNEEEPNQQ